MDEYVEFPRPIAEEELLETLARAASFPFDASEDWWTADKRTPPPEAKRWEIAAARGIMADLQRRSGFQFALSEDGIHESVRRQIIETIAKYIELAPAWFKAQRLGGLEDESDAVK